MRPITKQRALTFDNNNLSDFITKKKPKKKSLRRVQLVESVEVKSPAEKKVDNPFAVEEISKSPTDLQNDDRKVLKEIRNQLSPKKKIKEKSCQNQECPFSESTCPKVDFQEEVYDFGMKISQEYHEMKAEKLIHDHRLMLFVLSQPVISIEGFKTQFYLLVLVIFVKNSTLLPRGLFNPCVLQFLQKRLEAIQTSHSGFSLLKKGNYKIFFEIYKILDFNETTPENSQIKLKGPFKTGLFDAHQLQKRDFFTSQNQLAQFRKQRDEFHR